MPFCNRLKTLFFCLIPILTSSNIRAEETKDEKLAIDEAFLLFLANSTEKDGETVDQLDMLEMQGEVIETSFDPPKQKNSQKKVNQPMKNEESTKATKATAKENIQ